MSHCPYFLTAVFRITPFCVPPPVSAPAYRCLLSEEAVRRFLTDPLETALADTKTAITPDEEHHPGLGPDQDNITLATCTRTRMNESCCPTFVSLMDTFDLDTTLPTEKRP